MSAVDLDLGRLLDDARRATGLTDFGPWPFERSLGALLATYDHGMQLTERGKKTERRRLLGLLVNRLRCVAALERDPSIHTRPIHKPTFLTGLPRTGTSALFNLLGADAGARPLLLWEGNHPDPLATPLAAGEEDPRLVALRKGLEAARAANPGFSAIHDARADNPEECVQLLAHSMGFVQNGVEPLFSPYAEEFVAQDFGPAYDLYADLLRLIDAQRPGERWLLKTPAHLYALDHLVRLFPDATIVITHRDPRECVPSYCSMVRALLGQAESVDPHAIGLAVVDYLARSLERAASARRRLDPARFVDVEYRDFLADPLTTARRIHEAAGIPLATEALEAHIARNPQNKHGKHDYGLAEFGLTEALLRERLGEEATRYDREDHR